MRSIDELFYPKELTEIIADLRAKDDLKRIFKVMMMLFFMMMLFSVNGVNARTSNENLNADQKICGKIRSLFGEKKTKIAL